MNHEHPYPSIKSSPLSPLESSSPLATMDILFPWRKQAPPRPPQSSPPNSLSQPDERPSRYQTRSVNFGPSIYSTIPHDQLHQSIAWDSGARSSLNRGSKNGSMISSTKNNIYSSVDGSSGQPQKGQHPSILRNDPRTERLQQTGSQSFNSTEISIGISDLERAEEQNQTPAGSRAERRQTLQRSNKSTNYPLDKSLYSQSLFDSFRPPISEESEYIDEDDLPPTPLRLLLDAVNMSILPDAMRLASIAQAVEFFDHRDRAMHDSELREGAALVLYHKLGFALQLSRCGANAGEAECSATSSTIRQGRPNHYQVYQQQLATSAQSQRQSDRNKEIAMICSCLEMVHRANPDAIAQTWDDCGTEILPLLVSVLELPFQTIERCVQTSLKETTVPGSLERAVAVAVTRDHKLAVQKVTKVLAMYSLVPEAKGPMCACNGMLRWLTRIIDTHNYNRVKPGAPAIGGMTSSFKLGASMRSDATDLDGEKRMQRAHRATSGSGLYMTEAARFNTIATLTNLAALEDNRMSMLREPDLLDNICRVVHNERSDVPKQCSALAIMNLSNGDMDTVPEMAGNELVLETVLKLMKEDNPETRRNAVVTLFNIACSDQNTVLLTRYRDGTILEALTELVGSEDPTALHGDSRASAAETLFNMSCSEIAETTDRMANHAGLLECLAVTLRGEHTGLEVKMYCSATLRRMAELIRYPMIAHGALLSALVKASSWTSTDCVAEAFRYQASVPENCVVMAYHHGLLHALSRLALTKGSGADVDKVRGAAVATIELLSRHDEARALLAHNEGIIMALTRASYGEEGSFKESMKRSVRTEYEASLPGSGMDDSRRTETDDVDDEESLQSRRIQIALKNLVSAM